MLTKSKKIQLSFLLGFFAFFSLAGSFLLVKPVRAQMSVPISDANTTAMLAQNNVSEVKSTIAEKAIMVLMNAVVSGLNYFLNKVAYDSAVYLASGGKGQNPFAHKQGFKGYLGNVAGDALGEALGMLSNGIGLNLCDLPDIRLDLALKLGLYLGYDEPKPLCSWQQIKSAYNPENIKSKYGSQEGILSRMSVSLEVSGTDFGIWLDAKAKIDQYAIDAEKGAELDRQEGQGIKSFTDLITGEIKTPASVMQAEMIAQAPSNQQGKQTDVNMSMISSALGKGALQTVFTTAGTFVNTLLGTVLKNFMTQGMLPGGTKLCNPGLVISGINLEPCTDDQSSFASDYYSSGGSTSNNRRLAQEMFNDLLTPKVKTIENFQIINSIANCSKENKDPFSCLVDQSFLQILQSAEADKPMTIREAIENDYLHGGYRLISSADNLQNTKWNCAEDSAYCYRNLQQLRKLRILPLGFEVAANIAQTPEEIQNSPTLKDVVDGFNNSGSKYYKLLNPNWLIKLPKMRCGAQVAGTIAANGARVEECVDVEHCVAENKDGSCMAYGYCLKEEHYWNFDSDYCDWQNDTCKTFVADEGGKMNSYLSRTVDSQFCDENNVGCRRYATVKFATFAGPEGSGNLYHGGSWAPESIQKSVLSNMSSHSYDDVNPFNVSLTLNKNAQFCEEKDAGCSAFEVFKDSVTTTIYLKKAPDYLGCYDAETLPPNAGISSQAIKMLNGVQWPQSLVDLGQIQAQSVEECAKYAGICLPEEAGCNNYTAKLSREVIPGKFQPAELVKNASGDDEIVWNNQCDEKCVGYDSFKEMPSNYANGRNLAYIIPSSGKTCSAEDAGCTSFTNLSETAGDFEKVEYFSYLRSCILPDQNLQKNFYSYERTDAGDFRLVTYVLEKNDNGSPKLLFRDEADRGKNVSNCTALSYKLGQSPLDCRRLDDDAGNSYYIPISKTILVSDKCTPYRLTETELATDGTKTFCPLDYSGSGNLGGSNAVVMRDGACYYYGMPAGNTSGAVETLSCSAEVDSCRVYKGNTGNNIQLVIDDDFEGYANTGELNSSWIIDDGNDIELSTESTNATGHSLKLDPTNNAVLGKEFAVQSNKSYTLSFWARGGALIDRIYLNNDGSSEFLNGNLNISDVWHYYSFGPVEVKSKAGSDMLWFRLNGGPNSQRVLYLDNVRLTEVTDLTYLVRDSLIVDPICDSSPNDGLPGEALGCREFSDPMRSKFYLTGFNYLCRENAIGCTAMTDTFNTLDSAKPKIYNIWYKTFINDTGDKSITAGGETFTCFVPRGAGGCYMNIFGVTMKEIMDTHASDLVITSSTLYYQGDTSVNLVINKDSVCRSENLGCQKVGLSTAGLGGESFVDVFVKNDPIMYGSTLCNSQAIGCKSYSADGGKFYFKDPELTGNKICVFRDEPGGQVGWMIKDENFRICSNASSPDGSGHILSLDSKQCTKSTDCANNETCLLSGQVPCYNDYEISSAGLQLNGGSTYYGLRSNGQNGYAGFVGECPGDQNGCSEFLDPAVHYTGSTESKRCSISNKRCFADGDCELANETCVSNSLRSYYLIDSPKLRDSAGECKGAVSMLEGCVLFDKTSLPNKFWYTGSSYASDGSLKEAASYTADPIRNNANTILKVARDRMCSSWAYCSDYQVIKNEDTGEVTKKCHHLGVCDKALSTPGGGIAVTGCGDVITDSWENANQILDLNLFKSRATTWTAEEYSGYSMLDHFPISDYTPETLPVNYLKLTSTNDTKKTVLVVKKDSTACTNLQDVSASVSCTANEGDGVGKCYRGKCIVDISGDPVSSTTTPPILTCRAYPETSAPYDIDVFSHIADREWGGIRTGFEDINVCAGNSTDDPSCDCVYDKYKTAGGNVFIPRDWNFSEHRVPISKAEEKRGVNAKIVDDGKNEICVGGKYTGYLCDSTIVTTATTSEMCSEYGGFCAKKQGVSSMRGWQGFCIENDPRYKINGRGDEEHCLTWWPVESVSNDYWLLDKNAGYQVSDANVNRYQCLMSQTARYLNNIDRINYDTVQYDYYNTTINPYPEGIEIHEDIYAHGQTTFTNIPSNVLFYAATTPWNTATQNQTQTKITWGFEVDSNRNGFMFAPTKKNGFNAFFEKVLWDNSDLLSYYNNDNLGKPSKNLSSNRIEPNIWQHYFDNYSDHSHSEKLYENEIEMITVFLTNNQIDVGDDGYVSFVNKFVNDPSNELSDYCIGEFCIKYDLANLNDYTLKSGTMCNGQYGYWEWNGTDNADEKIIFTSDDESRICGYIGDGVEDVQGRYNFVKPTGSGVGTGIRVVFSIVNNQKFLEGIWLYAANNSGGAIVGASYAVHLAAGNCNSFAKVSETLPSGTDELDSFGFKPVAWRLYTDQVNFPDSLKHEGYLIVDREQDLDSKEGDFREYGLAKSDSIPLKILRESTGRSVGPLINPFVPIIDGTKRSNKSSDYHTYQGPEFPSGIPLVVVDEARNGDISSSHNSVTLTSSVYNFDWVLNFLRFTTPASTCSGSNSDVLPYCQMFKRMYAKTYSDSGTPSNMMPTLAPSFDAARPDNAAAIGLKIYPPHIAAPTGKTDYEFQMDNFSVNSYTGGNVILPGSGSEAVIKFYAWADPNQAPLRRIMVRRDGSDDDIVVSREISIGNRKANCFSEKYCFYGGEDTPDTSHFQISCESDSDCGLLMSTGAKNEGKCRLQKAGTAHPNGFGNSEETGCKTDPFEYVLSYHCDSTMTTVRADGVLSAKERSDHGLSASTQVCVFIPQVQVLDNWGWCSGKCSASPYTVNGDPRKFSSSNYGCYDQGSGGTVFGECNINNPAESTAWVDFNGKIIVPAGS